MTESTEHAGGQDPADNGQPTPGMQLAMRRQEFNWTVEQVASQLNLAPRQIHAMENDDYGALPGMAVARGFIRSYAKLLKLDSTPMLAQIPKAPGSAEQAMPLRREIPTATFTPHRAATRARQSGPSRLLLAAGVLIIGALAATALMQRDRLAEFAPPSLSGLFNTAPAGAPIAGEQKAGRVIDTDVAPPMTQVPAQPAPAAVAPAGMTPELSVPAAAPVAPPQSSNSLVLSLRQDSWVEVKRADNTIVAARVMRAGSSESFELTGPLMLTVGNARGVDAKVRGESLDLAGTTRNNVARVSVK
ncbi:MAG: RodZ domain-containing protein [Noviherbaspirillum sp.]